MPNCVDYGILSIIFLIQPLYLLIYHSDTRSLPALLASAAVSRHALES